MKNKGFTLIELLGVIIVLSLLVILVFPSIVNSVKTSSTKTDDLTKEMIYKAADLYISNHTEDFIKINGHKYKIVLKDLVDEKILTSPIKLSDSDDITNEKCIQVKYDNGYTYELKNSGECEEEIIYQQVEYIESSGTQEISNFYTVPSSYTTIEFETKTNTSSSAEQGIIGIDKTLELAYSAIANRVILWDSTKASLAYISTENALNNDVVLKATLSNEGTKILYTNLDGGQTVTSDTGYTSINNSLVDLFVYNGGAGDYYYNGKLYYAKVRVDDELVRYMIPCYRKSDGVIGMYDLINDKFYTNTGSGTFTKGDDV